MTDDNIDDAFAAIVGELEADDTDTTTTSMFASDGTRYHNPLFGGAAAMFAQLAGGVAGALEAGNGIELGILPDPETFAPEIAVYVELDHDSLADQRVSVLRNAAAVVTATSFDIDALRDVVAAARIIRRAWYGREVTDEATAEAQELALYLCAVIVSGAVDIDELY